MKGTIAVKTAPVTEPITTAEAKTHMRVDISDDDTYIATLITAARKYIEELTGVRMVTQTLYYYLDVFPEDDIIAIPVGPVTSVTSVKYTPTGESQETFSSSTGYETDLVSLPARIALKDGQSWPSNTLNRVNGVCVEFVAGYGSAAGLVAARADLAAAEALVAAATAGTLAAAQVALVAAVVAVSAAEAAAIAEIPEDLRSAVKLLVAHWYEHRMSVSGAEGGTDLKNIPMSMFSILENYRMWQREQ